MVDISIVIVSYNTKNLLEDCLSSLKKTIKQNNNVAVWVVDNYSSDNSAKMVRKKFPWVNLIANDKNFGFAKANNQAIRKIKSRYIFLLNPDTEILNNALDKMVSYMVKHKDVGILGPQLVNVDGSIQRELSPFPKLLDAILVLLKLHRLSPFSQLVYPNYDYSKIQHVEHLMGSALLASKEVFDQVGFFDESFFLWFEETDFEKRAKESGFKIAYYPKAKIKHLIGQSTRKANPFKRQTIWNKSLWRYFQKHRPSIDRLVLLPFMFLSYFPAALVYLKYKYQIR